ncbi:hypothetical protein BARVI_03430 [Barnesiella viscericola DSM 18177]|uniref:Uncharacterized protein n=1 Tax=Barnesiella viscericola DSM 18177 TaxID=880074 RepID=W0ES66_9BACT|nr:hypothetical protein BARVI_03430 [Barnesiella viscericola DSM 18177]
MTRIVQFLNRVVAGVVVKVLPLFLQKLVEEVNWFIFE